MEITTDVKNLPTRGREQITQNYNILIGVLMELAKDIEQQVKIAIAERQDIPKEILEELAKDIKKKGENAKVAIRNIRRDAIDAIKKKGKEDSISEDEIKGYEDDVQKSTDAYVKKIDDAIDAKSKEIMTV